MDIVKLLHQGELVGYRFINGDSKFDVAKNAVLASGVALDGIDRSVTLTEVGNLLLSRSELESGVVARDVSTDPQALNNLLNQLGIQAEA